MDDEPEMPSIMTALQEREDSDDSEPIHPGFQATNKPTGHSELLPEVEEMRPELESTQVNLQEMVIETGS